MTPNYVMTHYIMTRNYKNVYFKTLMRINNMYIFILCVLL